MEEKEYSLSKILKKIRLDYGFTQRELADKIACSQELISKIELDRHEVTDDILLALSTVYKIDLLNYKADIKKFNSFKEYKAYNELLIYFDYRTDLKKIEKMLKNKTVQGFDYGEPLLLKRHCKALLELNLYNNPQKAIESALENLECTLEEFLELEPKTLKSPFYYSSVLLLSIALYEVGKVDLVSNIFEKYLNHYKPLLDSGYVKHSKQGYLHSKIYLLALSNYAYMVFTSGDYEKANKLCDYTLIESKKHDKQYAIPDILKLKTEIFYKDNKIDEAKAIFMHLKLYCMYNMNSSFFNKTEEGFKNAYPLLFVGLEVPVNE